MVTRAFFNETLVVKEDHGGAVLTISVDEIGISISDIHDEIYIPATLEKEFIRELRYAFRSLREQMSSE